MSEGTSAPAAPSGGGGGEVSNESVPQATETTHRPQPGEFSVVDMHHPDNPTDEAEGVESEEAGERGGFPDVDAPEGGGEELEAHEGETLDAAEPQQLTAEQLDELEVTYKVDGEDVTKTVADIKKDAELREASYTRMEEASALKKSVTNVIGRLQNASPMEFAGLISKMGHDPVQFAEVIASEYLKRAKMTPEQREMADFQFKKAEFARQQEMAHEQERQAEIARRTPQYQDHFVSAYTGAMEAAGVPSNEPLRQALMQRMAQRDLQTRQNGYVMEPADLLKSEWSAIQAAANKLGVPDHQRQERLKALPDTRPFNGKKGAAAPAKKAAKKGPMKTYRTGNLSDWSAMLDEM